MVHKKANNMTEAGIAAFSVTVGVAISLAIICFVLRGKGHADGSHNHDYDKVTADNSHVHVEK